MKKRFSPFPLSASLRSIRRNPWLRSLLFCSVSLLTGWIVLCSQVDRPVALGQDSLQQQENQEIRKYQLPSEPAPAPVYRPPAPAAPEPAPAPAPAPEPEPAPAPAPEPEPAPVQPDRRSPEPEPEPSPPSDKPAETPEEKPQELKSDTTEVAALGPTSQYVLEFNRSPVVGNRFRMEGIYAESRLGFTRPRGWQVKGAKAIVRFQHSPNLMKEKSNLVFRINDTSVGSVPLNLNNSQLGEAVVPIPANLIQDFNELTLVAQQENDAECSKPGDKALWTEVLPDSKIILDYQPQAFPLNFNRYPYPFFDNLALDVSRINYLQPQQLTASWLTAASRFQATMGRLADFRPLETAIVPSLAKRFKYNDRLVIIGTPAQQPQLKSLKLPLKITGNEFIDGGKTAFGEEVGLVMLATAQNGQVPVLIITGNGEKGVERAAQFLIQPQSKIGDGTLIVVSSEVPELPPPPLRDWERFIPSRSQFTLADLKGNDNKPFQDTTVRGSSAPRIDFNFRALPDDFFIRGSSMTIHYSHSAQIDTSKSTVSVFIDNVGIGSKKLADEGGVTDQTFTIDLPPNLVSINSRIGVDFKLVPRKVEECGPAMDQQLWATLMSKTSFNMNREISVELPNLKLLTVGYPFAAPQDLSRTAIALPANPSQTELLTLLKFSERLGRVSRSETVRQTVFLGDNLPDSIKQHRHLVGIGTRDRFPIKEVFQDKNSFNLVDQFTRQFRTTQVQTLPSNGGFIKSILSPWSKNDRERRVILALSAQTEEGLKQVQDVLDRDSWFYQLQEDTTLISSNPNVSPFDSNGYQFQFLRMSPSQNLANINPVSQMRRLLQNNWWMLPSGIVGLSLLLYGIAQLYLKRVAGESK
ncbi:MAG: cellulose biosynthesis cyclic di-GMP-binding regulatory protein BcsB [Synechococcales bacterium]|nr:cellulose biosynthesis cyclic di-GMP-binding regulatory protein BcsB [Synechococcales bacterium]